MLLESSDDPRQDIGEFIQLEELWKLSCFVFEFGEDLLDICVSTKASLDLIPNH